MHISGALHLHRHLETSRLCQVREICVLIDVTVTQRSPNAAQHYLATESDIHDRINPSATMGSFEMQFVPSAV